MHLCLESIEFSNINQLKHNKEQDIEIAAIQLNIQNRKIIVICVYRAPCGNFELFLNKLEMILNSIVITQNSLYVAT
jgi:hypothetical protein